MQDVLFHPLRSPHDQGAFVDLPLHPRSLRGFQSRVKQNCTLLRVGEKGAQQREISLRTQKLRGVESEHPEDIGSPPREIDRLSVGVSKNWIWILAGRLTRARMSSVSDRFLLSFTEQIPTQTPQDYDQKISYATAALAASVAFASAATVVYTENFDAAGSADRSLNDFGWKGVLQNATTTTNLTVNPARLTTGANLSGTASYGAYISGTTQEQWLLSDFTGTLQQITEISFNHKETIFGTTHGYQVGLKIGPTDWYVTTAYIVSNAITTNAVIDLSTALFIKWADASTGDTDGWTTNPATTGGAVLTSGQAKAATGFGIFTTADSTSDAYRFDDIKITAIPEPSSAALLGLGGLAFVLRRRK